MRSKITRRYVQLPLQHNTPVVSGCFFILFFYKLELFTSFQKFYFVFFSLTCTHVRDYEINLFLITYF